MKSFSLKLNNNSFQEIFGLDPLLQITPRYNITPTSKCPIVTSNDKTLTHAYWGNTKEWANKKSLGNRLVGILATKLLTNSKINSRLKRCLIPCDGFYLWKNAGKKDKIPYRYALAENEAFYLLGVTEVFENNKNENIDVFRIIWNDIPTQSNNYETPPPIAMNKTLSDKWLNSEEDNWNEIFQKDIFKELQNYSINPKISDPKFDSPDLWEHTPPTNQLGNYTLFD